MNILFDENFPRPLHRFFLPEHQVTTVQKMDWLEAENGDLLAIAEAEFDLLLSTDKGMKYQQNFTGRDIAVITLRARDNRISTLIPLIPQVLALLKFWPSCLPSSQARFTSCRQKRTAAHKQS